MLLSAGEDNFASFKSAAKALPVLYKFEITMAFLKRIYAGDSAFADVYKVFSGDQCGLCFIWLTFVTLRKIIL